MIKEKVITIKDWYSFEELASVKKSIDNRYYDLCTTNRKSIEIQNFDDPTNLKKIITSLQKRRKNILRSLGYDVVRFNNSKYNSVTILPIIEELYDFKLPEELTGYSKYYAYFHCNPLKKLNAKHNLKHLFLATRFPGLLYEPFYVGKGSGNRAYDLSRNSIHRKIRTNILKFKKDVEVYVIQDKLYEEQALNIEAKLIDILGLQYNSKEGMLCNLDEGYEYINRRNLYKSCNNFEIIKRLLKANKFNII